MITSLVQRVLTLINANPEDEAPSLIHWSPENFLKIQEFCQKLAKIIKRLFSQCASPILPVCLPPSYPSKFSIFHQQFGGNFVFIKLCSANKVEAWGHSQITRFRLKEAQSAHSLENGNLSDNYLSHGNLCRNLIFGQSDSSCNFKWLLIIPSTSPQTHNIYMEREISTVVRKAIKKNYETYNRSASVLFLNKCLS